MGLESVWTLFPPLETIKGSNYPSWIDKYRCRLNLQWQELVRKLEGRASLYTQRRCHQGGSNIQQYIKSNSNINNQPKDNTALFISPPAKKRHCKIRVAPSPSPPGPSYPKRISVTNDLKGPTCSNPKWVTFGTEFNPVCVHVACIQQ